MEKNLQKNEHLQILGDLNESLFSKERYRDAKCSRQGAVYSPSLIRLKL